MPTKTYLPLATVTTGSASSSITFSSIPATYRDLILVINGQLASNNTMGLRFNSDSGSNYLMVMMRDKSPTGAESLTETGTSIYTNWSTARSGDRHQTIFQIMDYSATDKHKTVLSRNNYTDITPLQRSETVASRWTNTSAITSMTLITGTNALSSGFTASLYGITSTL